MNRTRMMIAALAVALAATGAGAQRTGTPAGQARAAESRPPRQRAGKARKAGRKADRAALRGVDLTDAQTAQLEALREKYKAEAKPIAGRVRPAMQEARAARQKGDTAAARAAFDRTAADRAALRAVNERQRAEMLAILTPEQRAKAEANLRQVKVRREGKMKAWKARKG